MERQYYTINENLARQAQGMWSFSDYKEGSKTAAYRSDVDKAYDLVEKIENERPREAERAFRIATIYSRRLADNMNRQSRIELMCPSIMIAGGGNFPVRKKEKQNAARYSAMKEWNDIQGYITKLKNILNGKEIIKANDEYAILRLEDKLSELEAKQDWMKAVNVYYRKHKTLDDCPELTADQIEKMKAEIRRLKKRIESLKAIKAEDNTETRYDDLGLTVKINTDAVRIQLFFDDKPDTDVRDIVKSCGFHWAKTIGCWQRQITNNAKYALRNVLAKLKKLQAH